MSSFGLVYEPLILALDSNIHTKVSLKILNRTSFPDLKTLCDARNLTYSPTVIRDDLVEFILDDQLRSSLVPESSSSQSSTVATSSSTVSPQSDERSTSKRARKETKKAQKTAKKLRNAELLHRSIRDSVRAEMASSNTSVLNPLPMMIEDFVNKIICFTFGPLIADTKKAMERFSSQMETIRIHIISLLSKTMSGADTLKYILPDLTALFTAYLGSHNKAAYVHSAYLKDLFLTRARWVGTEWINRLGLIDWKSAAMIPEFTLSHLMFVATVEAAHDVKSITKDFSKNTSGGASGAATSHQL